MSNEVDRYDVEAMIRDARHEISREISRAISALRDDTRESLADLRSGLVELSELLERVEA